MYPNLTPFLVGLGGAGLLVAVAMAARGPLTRRLALRQLNRRRAEAALVVAGSVLGTAIIVGSLVVGDTLDQSFRQNAYRELGVVDEVVSSPDPAQGEEAARRLEPLRGDPAVLGLLTVRRPGVAAVSDGKGEPRATLLELDFAAAASFEGPGSSLAGPAPGRGRVVLSDSLADAVDARAGDRVTFHLDGRPVTLQVARVVPARGLAGFGEHGAFVEPGTLSWVAGPVGGRAGPETLTLVSNTGGVEGGAAASDQVKAKLQAALGPLGGQGTAVATPKQELLEEAEAIGGEFGALFLFIGSFAIIAGVMLLVNVFVMLAEERKGELGMLRAVGLRRGRLIRGFVIEGTVYALVASALGLVAGLGVGRAVIEVTARIFASFATEGGPLLTFTVTPTSLVNGFAAGFLIAFLTVALTSIRISRVNIIAAIRDLPPGTGRPLKRRWVVLSSLVAAGFGAAAVVAIAGSPGVGGRPLGQAGRGLPGGQALPDRGHPQHVRPGGVPPGADLGARVGDRLGRRPGRGPGVRRVPAAGRLPPLGGDRRPGRAADGSAFCRPGGRGRAPGLGRGRGAGRARGRQGGPGDGGRGHPGPGRPRPVPTGRPAGPPGRRRPGRLAGRAGRPALCDPRPVPGPGGVRHGLGHLPAGRHPDPRRPGQRPPGGQGHRRHPGRLDRLRGRRP